ncbi:hypothetical protein H9X90_10855 [Faecalicatena contorta]|uniref:hypothetical protein n=1 Tax=Faecalicatena contorta TaxID=39482 RepID=UPI001960B446|nr:hypothetical protein [Faecalicatena contorta]MBM6685551.1 hypothetical protein [Faecalicatena contorta]MBM6711234.1 hypothetical protein [Faecalicatena contorta]
MAEKTLEQVTREIEQVLELNDAGQTVAKISQALELEEDYICSILVCRQSHSDDAASIAHMVMME